MPHRHSRMVSKADGTSCSTGRPRRIQRPNERCCTLESLLVTAREDLEHNAKLYIDTINSCRAVKEEHAGLPKSNCWRLSWLGKTALTYTERMLAKGAKYREKLTAQPGQAKIESFDCIRKLLPTVLFEKKYPYNEKFARYYHADLLKVHPDPAPFTCTSTPTISKDLGGSGAPPKKKT
ncbi:hypothetical protein Tco_1381421 [Tanacetum coccineum]